MSRPTSEPGFPTDEDVEVAAKAMSRSFGYQETAWRRWAVAARAALEAVKDVSGFPEQGDDEHG